VPSQSLTERSDAGRPASHLLMLLLLLLA